MAKKNTQRKPQGNVAAMRGWLSHVANVPVQLEDVRERVATRLRTVEGRVARLRSQAQRESAALVRNLQKQFQRKLALLRTQTRPPRQGVERGMNALVHAVRESFKHWQRSAQKQARRVLVEQLELAARTDIESLHRRIEAMEKRLARLHKEKVTRLATTAGEPA